MEIIRPNSVYSEGIPKTEDYIIYANLEVKKRSRSILASDNTSDTISTLNISFLNYEKNKNDVGESTTNWTNEYIGKDKVNDETFGMTDISIKFDKNNIPEVTIEFIDVRGVSLIGQGEDSPYSALFHLPYPEFTLTIKGYYGKAVQYKLSLLDFSSRFNSQTGNFEITCQFIGFTYAKLTDIPAAYILFAKEINGKKPKASGLPYLWDFIKQIGELNILIETIEKESSDVKDITLLSEILESIKNFKDEYSSGGKNNIEFFKKEQYIKGGTFWENLKILNKFGINFDYTRESFILSLNTKQFNDKNNVPPYAFWQSSTIKSPNGTTYLSKTLIESFSENGENSFKSFKESQQKKVENSFNKLIEQIETKIQEKSDKIKEEINNKTKDILGDRPTIKRVFEIILDDTEIFLNKIRDVAINAENQQNDRQRLFPINNSDLNINLKNNIIYAFPSYYESKKNGEYVHTYMGTNKSISDNRSAFPELDLVEDYLKFQQTLNDLNQENFTIRPESGWFPVTPLESVYYYDSPQDRPLSPYNNITSEIELLDKIIDRFILLLSSYGINKDNTNIFKTLSKLEFKNLLLSFPEESSQFKILKSLKNSLVTQIKNRIKSRISTNINDKKLFKRTRQNVLGQNEELVFKETEIPVNTGKFLDNNVAVKIFDFESNVANNNIDDTLIDDFNIYYSFFSKWFTQNIEFLRTEKFVKDDKSNLVRVLLDYENFIKGRTLGSYILTTNGVSLLNDVIPTKLDEEIVNWFFTTRNGYPKENLISGRWIFIGQEKNVNNNNSTMIFLNYLYKLNWDNTKKLLSNITGVVEIPYFVILQIGSILWDNFNNNRDGYNKILDFENGIPITNSSSKFDLSYYDKIVDSFVDWEENRNVFINEFLIFTNSFDNLYNEIQNTVNLKFISGELRKINLKTDTPNLYNFVNKNKILINPSYRIWDLKTIDNIGFYRSNVELWQPFIAKEENNQIIFTLTNNDLKDSLIKDSFGNTFFNTFQSELKKHIDEIEKNTETNKKSLKDTLKGFDDFKLETYNSFKSLYDRWIAGNNENIKLKEDFVYINRFYKNIGDILVVNPQSLINIKNNPKITLYSILSNLLTENRMDFHPLPGFITNMDAKPEDIFGQFITIDKNLITKPKFVCMYVGGTSKQLNRINGYFRDDTPDFKPKDFPDGNTELGKDFSLPFSFEVDYGSQNHSHFKELQLDQKQFKVTNESLRIEDEIAQSANTRRGIVLGQSLYSVFLERSYSCTVSGLGNAMIQPTMYFYLPTIPLFKGYYLIINVQHTIKPNFMETSFTGVRISLGTVPIVETYSEALGLGVSKKDDITTSNEDGWLKQLNSLT